MKSRPAALDHPSAKQVLWLSTALLLASVFGPSSSSGSQASESSITVTWPKPARQGDFGPMRPDSFFASILRAPTDATFNEGGAARFTCLAKGNPVLHITWSHNGRELPASLTTSRQSLLADLTLESESTLTLPNITKMGDRGGYQCNASNIHKHAIAYAYLSVYVPPTILVAPVNQSLLAGSTLTLSCQTFGDPAPTVSWFKDNIGLSQDGLLGRVSFYRGPSTLVVFRTEIGDAGRYHCQASNKDAVAGSTVNSDPAVVLVNRPPKIEPPLPETVYGFVGELLPLTCTFTGHPRAEGSWCKLNNGRCVSKPTNCAWTAADAADNVSVSTILTFDPAEKCHRGLYRCVVGNSVRNVTSDVTVVVTDVVNVGVEAHFSSSNVLPGSHLAVDATYRAFALRAITDTFGVGEFNLVHFSYSLNGSNSVSMTLDIQTPVRYVGSIADAISRLQFNMSSVRVQVPTIPLSLRLVAAAFRNYDLCSDVATPGGIRGTFHWPNAYRNSTATLPCPIVLGDGQLRFGTRRCGRVPRPHNASLYMAEWTMPSIVNCPTVTTARLFEISKVLFNVNDPDELISHTATIVALTMAINDLTEEDINFASVAIFRAADTIEVDIGLIDSLTKQIANSALLSVDNILTLNATKIISASAMRLAKAVEGTMRKLLTHPRQPFQALKNNIGISINCPNISTAEGLRFSSPAAAFNVGSVPGGAQESHSRVTFDIPATAINESTQALRPNISSLCPTAPTRFVLYKTTSLFQDLQFSSNMTLASDIISAQVGAKRLENLSEPVVMAFDLSSTQPGPEDEVLCVWWDFNQDDGNGGWSSSGCHTEPTLSNMRAICRCNHLTNFAVLLSRRAPSPSTEDEALKYVTLVGIILSMMGLIATIITILSIKNLRKRHHHRMILGLCATLVVFLTLFLAILYAKTLRANNAACKSVGICAHYLLLCAFMWMSADATFLYKQIVIVFHRWQEQFVPVLHILILAIPCLIVILSASGTNGDYIGSQCWIEENAAFYGALVAPMVISVLYNFTLFALIFRSRHQRVKRQAARQTSPKNRDAARIKLLRTTLTLSVVLGITWLFGFLVLLSKHVAFEYLFTIFNSLQGVGIFLNVLNAHEVRKNWSVRLSSIGRVTASTRDGSSSFWSPSNATAGITRETGDGDSTGVSASAGTAASAAKAVDASRHGNGESP